MSDLLRVLAVVALVAANAVLVIGEFAVVTARRARLAPHARRSSRRAQAALRLLDDPVRVISTTQIVLSVSHSWSTCSATGATDAAGEQIRRTLRVQRRDQRRAQWERFKGARQEQAPMTSAHRVFSGVRLRRGTGAPGTATTPARSRSE